MIQKNVLHSLNVNTLFCIICLHSLKYRIYNKKEKVTPFFATFSFVLFLFYDVEGKRYFTPFDTRLLRALHSRNPHLLSLGACSTGSILRSSI